MPGRFKGILVSVRYARKAKMWEISVRGHKFDEQVAWTTKAKAVKAAVALCRSLHASGERVQLMVHRRDNAYDFERTYGYDPPSRKG